MGQFFKMFFASLLAMIIAGVIVFGLLVGMMAGVAKSVKSDQPAAGAKKNSVLVIDTEDLLHEQGETNSLAAFTSDDAYAPGLYDVLNAINSAKKDNDIKGILIRLGGSFNGWATMQQLRDGLKDFKSSGKKVYAYGEIITQKSYYLASIADSVFCNPAGFIELKGLSSELPFFKGTLEKLEIQPEIFYAGKFKSATEPFRADKMSEPNRLQVSELQQDIWQQFLEGAAAHAKTDTTTVNSWVQAGTIQFPSDAVKYKLVDALLYWDQVEDRLRTLTGKKGDDKVSYTDMSGYANYVRNDKDVKDQKVAVLFAEGNIIDGDGNDDYQIASEDMAKNIRRLRMNDKVKAVVLRVNSPGGSALASEVILRELQLLKAKKPLIVSMGDVAASGGYYIACQADSIFALPNTVTGSIGVFAMLFNSGNLLKNKLGVTFDQVKNAPYADFPTVTRPLTEDEARRMQASVDTIYNTFMSRVAVGRRIPVNMVDSIAQGRVWSGTDALRIGLVDGLGDLDRAVASAAAKAGLKEYQLITYPDPVDKFKAMLQRFGGNAAAAAQMNAALEKELGADFKWYRQVKELKLMNGRALMMVPFAIGFN
jgi:protease-4